MIGTEPKLVIFFKLIDFILLSLNESLDGKASSQSPRWDPPKKKCAKLLRALILDFLKISKAYIV